MKSSRLFLFAASFSLMSVALFAGEPRRDGNWQITMQSEIPGMPFKIPATTVTVCVTPEEAAKEENTVPKASNDKDCKVGDYKIEGNKVSWTIECPKSKTTGSGEITYSTDAYEGLMEMNVDGQEMSTKLKAKRLGDCAKKK